jgi:hypothetical protein
MSDKKFIMIPLEQLKVSKHYGGKYEEFIKAALANPGMAVLVEGAMSVSSVLGCRAARYSETKVKATKREGLIYVFADASPEPHKLATPAEEK